MLDPLALKLPAPFERVLDALADATSLPTIKLHGHEVLLALSLYVFIGTYIAPLLSNYFVPERYKAFNKRTRINWNVHVVSFFQSCIICALSLYVIIYDEERKQWRPKDQYQYRIFGYTGVSGLLQSFGLGYFLWDLYMCTRYVGIFGVGMLAHAVSAVTVFALGFRPFLYFSAPVFLLYELSSPFLNIHWFCDKLDLTGSNVQAINGAFLVGTFFCCRLLWGSYSSFLVFSDIFQAMQAGLTKPTQFEKFTAFLREGDLNDPLGQTTAFMGVRHVPVWLGVSYLASNLVLNALNFYWFNKMIQTIRSRFDPPWGTKGVGPSKIHWEVQEKEPQQADGKSTSVQRGVYADGSKTVEVSGTAQRSTRSRRKA